MLTRPLSDFDWITPQRLRQLDRFGLSTVEDLLTHFPRRYENRLQFDRFPDDEQDAAVCVCGIATATSLKRLGGWRRMFEVTLQEEEAHVLSRSLVCRWFNSPWVEKMIPTGQRVVVYGRPRRKGRRICIDHPEFEVVEEGADASIHLNRITPVHRATEGLSPRILRTLIHRTLEATDLSTLASPLPPDHEESDLTYGQALRAIHFPSSWDEQKSARDYLVRAEFFRIQLFLAARRAEHQTIRREPHCGPGDWLDRFHRSLPFPLTGAQQRALREIRADLLHPHPMNRLLHGDVGSGKTLVALSAMLLTAEAGHQAALMAPTQILAEQHFLTCRRWLEPLGLRIALRTGARREDTSLPLFDNAAGASPLPNDEPHIVIGTHALLYEGAGLSRLGLAVIDEQHKFGVLQRARLIARGEAPDILVMTATPIPRTLTMTVYGDLDVSTLDEMPANRGKIVTGVRDESKLPDAVRFLREQLEAGRQAYIVYPLIDESAKLEAKAAAAEFEKWRALLDPFPCELLHGRIEPAEKDAIMERFRRGGTRVLIATTVIEVGIDVPNATLMLVENAERFGLAQLHQLRGRIGRGTHKSYCILIHSAASPESMEKLAILERTANGFEIAEADLRLRGAGDLLGTAQSGLPPLALGDLIADAPLMQEARQAATDLFRHDPALEKPAHQRFRSLLEEGRKLALAQVS